MGYTSIPDESLGKLSQLSGKTIYVYLLLRRKLKYKRGYKNKLIPINDVMKVSYMDAKNMGIGKNTFGRAMESLVSVGLAEIAKHGKFGGRRPVEYRIK